MEDDGKNYEFGFYVVGIVDLLSQSNALDKWSNIAPGTGSRDGFIEIARQTVGNVLIVRRALETFCSTLSKKATPPWVDALPLEKQLLLRQMQPIDVKIQQFSDTIILYSSVRNVGSTVSVSNVYRVMTALVAGMVYALASKIPIRGGIEIERAVELSSADIYGPALLKAYKLESKVAEYPRIAAGNGLVSFLRTFANAPRTEPIATLNAVVAERCLKMLFEDEDQVVALDWVATARSSDLGIARVAEILKACLNFATDEEHRLAAAGDKKLSPRYSRLRSYLKKGLAAN